MIVNSELIRLKPKKIVYNNIRYYVRFSLNNNNDSYYIQLYKRVKDLICPIVVYSSETIEEADISQNYELVFTATIDIVIKKLEQVDNVAIHSPTYIQDLIETFLKMYLEKEIENEKLNKEKTLQLENYEKWDGVIKL